MGRTPSVGARALVDPYDKTVVMIRDDFTAEKTIPYMRRRLEPIDQLWSGEILCPRPEPPEPKAPSGLPRAIGWLTLIAFVVAAWSWALVRWASS